MQLKYDSEFCGSLPLHFINHIQSYGILLVLEPERLKFVQVSKNVAEHLQIDAGTLSEDLLSNHIPAWQLASLKEKLQSGIKENFPFTLTFTVDGAARDFLSIIHIKESYLVFELEAINTAAPASFISVYQELKFAMAAIGQATDVDAVSVIAVRELKKLSGFDRVMVYKFDEHWNGIVIAETLAEGMEPYLGLRFPASDIPKQARALYEKNPYRLIPDREYEPVKLHPVINPITQEFTDLSDCNLRSVAAVHVEYLKNMKVTASMSTRIMKNGQLWGLISCHHRTAKQLSYEECSMFELLSEVISAKLASIQNEEDFSYSTMLQETQAQLLEQVYSTNNLAEALLEGEKTILDLVSAEGAVVAHNKEIRTIGKTPSVHDIKDIIMWLQTHNIDKVFTTDSITELDDNGIKYSDLASGMIVLPVQKDKGEYIIGFRPELIKEVNWGGNPNETIVFEQDKKNYHPRNSFKLWQQTVKNTSRPWHSQEIAIAENFRHILIELSFKKVYT